MPPIDADDGVSLLSYPSDPSPVEGAACASDQAAHWTVVAPSVCLGKRTCIDERMRFWVDGEPFFPRGLYNGGYEYARLADNCPEGEACGATTPADADAYVAMLVVAGFNVIMERTVVMASALRDAVHGEARMKLAHLLWSDPFTEEGHAGLVDDIDSAVADEDVIMWFGPDEIDIWGNWHDAAGIRRLLRGSDPEIDALLTGKHAPPGDPFIPATQVAHDPLGLPFGAALAYDPGLSDGTDVYDMLLPITYPFEEPYSEANVGVWGTWRTSYFGDQGVPMVPVLQMVGIPEMGLWQPTPGHIEAQIMSSLIHGARGAFYYNLIGDKPSYGGRDGWFAADQAETWAAYTEHHARVDRLFPVLFSPANETTGMHEHLEWRAWELDGRRAIAIVNPTPFVRTVDLDAIVALAEGQYVRRYDDCARFVTRELEVAAYQSLLLEVY